MLMSIISMGQRAPSLTVLGSPGGEGTVTEVTSTNTDLLTVANGTTTPALTVVTQSPESGGTGLSTSSQVYNYVTGQGYLSQVDTTSANIYRSNWLQFIQNNVSILDNQTASEVPVTDSGHYFTSSDVEGALAEIGYDLSIADLVNTNEGSLTVSSGGTNIALISSNTSGSTDVGIQAAGTNSLSIVGNSITITGSAGSSTFGSDNQIPFTNSGGTDFDYSSGFTFNGSNLTTSVSSTSYAGSFTNTNSGDGGGLYVRGGSASGTLASLYVQNYAGTPLLFLQGNGHLQLLNLTNATKTNILYIDPSTKEVTYGLAPSAASVSSVNAGNLIDVSSTTGNVTVNVDLSELSTDATATTSDYIPWLDNTNGQKKMLLSTLQSLIGGVSDGNKGDITVTSGVWNINSGAVGTNEIATDGVGADEIATGAVGASELASSYISGKTAITSGLISTDELPISDGGTAKRMDVSVLQDYLKANTYQTKAVTIENPGSAEDISLFYTDEAITIQKLSSVLIGSSTPSVTWTIRYASDRSAAGTEVNTGGKTTTSITTAYVVTSFNNASIPANSFIWLETSGQGGVVDEMNLTLKYTVN